MGPMGRHPYRNAFGNGLGFRARSLDNCVFSKRTCPVVFFSGLWDSNSRMAQRPQSYHMGVSEKGP